MVVAIIAVNGRTRSNIRPICQVEFENLVTTMVVVNPDVDTVLVRSIFPIAIRSDPKLMRYGKRSGKSGFLMRPTRAGQSGFLMRPTREQKAQFLMRPTRAGGFRPFLVRPTRGGFEWL